MKGVRQARASASAYLESASGLFCTLTNDHIVHDTLFSLRKQAIWNQKPSTREDVQQSIWKALEVRLKAGQQKVHALYALELHDDDAEEMCEYLSAFTWGTFTGRGFLY